MRAGERRFHEGAGRLRAAERLERLEVPRVARLCLRGLRASTVLDVGTGTGVFAEAFAAQNLEVTGIDVNRELLARAREVVPGASFVEGTAEQLPFADRSFDLVFLGLVLHETDDPAMALAEAHRVTRQRVAILEWPLIEEEHGPPLAHRLAPPRIEQLAARAGLHGMKRITLSHTELFLCQR